jgi:hypothetical protein
LGYVWKRPRYVLDLDPSARIKRRIRRKIRGLTPRWVKLFEDETDLLLFPPLRAAWGLRGESLEMSISGSNARRVVFGTINIDTGHQPHRRRILRLPTFSANESQKRISQAKIPKTRRDWSI